MPAVPDEDPADRGGGAEQLLLPELPAAAAGDESHAASETGFAAWRV